MLSNVIKPRNLQIQRIVHTDIIPILTDVTLRDGLQTEPAEKWPLSKKQSLFHQIVSTYSPANIEIGSFVNPKILPIMSDTKQMIKFASDYKRIYGSTMNYSAVVPSMSKLHEALDHHLTHFSFLTSVSNAFQIKNVKKSLKHTKEDLELMTYVLKYIPNIYTKLYISCISECPLNGPLDINITLNEICKYHHNYNFNELCLSDTCGTLTFDDFKYLVDSLYLFGVPKSKISLHLHMRNMDELKQIVRYSLLNGYVRFDVSILESGGCSVTMDDCAPNMTYSVFSQIYNNTFVTK